MIDWTRDLTAVGIGALDEVLNAEDEKSGRVDFFTRATDWGRMIGAGLGLAMQGGMLGNARMGDTLALTCLPLATKSLSGPIRDAIGGRQESASRARDYVPRRRVPSRSRYPAPAFDTEFQGTARLD